MAKKNQPFLSRLIWIDLEMSGLNPHRNVILEAALIVTDSRLNIVAESESWAVRHGNDVLDHMDAWNERTHAASGLIDRCRASDKDVKAVEREILKFLAPLVGKKSSPICGNSICQDRRFLASHMPLLEDYFHYRNFDVSTFKIAAQLYYPAAAEKIKGGASSEHRALEDIRASIAEMRAYMNAIMLPPEEESAGLDDG